MSATELNINGRTVISTDVSLDDLIWLYNDFTEKNGRAPKFSECIAKNNLPQSRIINKILKENGIIYKDFLAKFGKFSKVRTYKTVDYQMMVDKFIDVCNKEGRTLTQADLTCNQYGLPGESWFIKYCPDSRVNTFTDFLDYCGLKSCKHIWTKEEVAKVLIDYELKLGRPIIKEDIKSENTCFSLIVIMRLYGGLSNAKKEIGLMETVMHKPIYSFEHYRDRLQKIIENYKSETGNIYISWESIESGKYGERVEHKTCKNAFERRGLDLHSFIRSNGCMINTTRFSNPYTFQDGEKVDSNLEFKVSSYLKSLGLVYKKIISVPLDIVLLQMLIQR